MLQIEANFDEQEAAKCLYWIKLMTDVEGIAGDLDSVDGSHDTFYHLLGDGLVLCKWVKSHSSLYNDLVHFWPTVKVVFGTMCHLSSSVCNASIVAKRQVLSENLLGLRD